MKHSLTCILALGILIVSRNAETQNRWSVEIRSGVSTPTQDMGGLDFGTGYGFEGTMAYRFMPHMATYVGWGWNQLPHDRSGDVLTIFSCSDE
ncbi:hypothetical protein LLG96_15480 [bacterium]|nr:hypothetical protein [bacterium]